MENKETISDILGGAEELVEGISMEAESILDELASSHGDALPTHLEAKHIQALLDKEWERNRIVAAVERECETAETVATSSVQGKQAPAVEGERELLTYVDDTTTTRDAIKAVGAEVKLNLLSQRSEISIKGKQVGNVEEGKAEFRLYEIINKRVLIQREDKPAQHFNYSPLFPKRLQSLGIDNSYDPCHDYLAELPEHMQASKPWHDCFEFTEPDEYVDAVFNAWFEQLFMRMQTAGCTAPHMLLIHGRQGVGKSTLARALCPVKDWFGDTLNFTADERTKVDAMSGKLVMEVAELAHRKVDNDRQKDFISRTGDRIDMKYQRTETYPRRCLFIATTNNDKPLPYDEEGRRYWPLSITAAKQQREGILKSFADEMLALLSAAKQRCEDKGSDACFLPADVQAQQREAYAARRFVVETEETILDILHNLAERGVATDMGNDVWRFKVRDIVGQSELLKTYIHPRDVSKFMRAYSGKSGRERFEGTQVRNWTLKLPNEVCE